MHHLPSQDPAFPLEQEVHSTVEPSQRVAFDFQATACRVFDALCKHAIPDNPELKLPQGVLDFLRAKYRRLMDDDHRAHSKSAFTGVFAESIFVNHLKSTIDRESIPLRPVGVRSMKKNLKSFLGSDSFRHGILPDTVVFRDGLKDLDVFEADLLCASFAKDAYVAFDVTMNHDKESIEKRILKLRRATQKPFNDPLSLIDVVLDRDRSSLDFPHESIAVINLPCKADFDIFMDRLNPKNPR